MSCNTEASRRAVLRETEERRGYVEGINIEGDSGGNAEPG